MAFSKPQISVKMWPNLAKSEALKKKSVKHALRRFILQ